MQVINVISWYWIVWIPLLTSSLSLRSVTLSMIASSSSFAALFALFDHILTDLLSADIHKWSQMRQSKGLSAILVAGYLRNDLGGHVAGSKETVRLLDHRLTDHSTILQHILQIDQVAVVLLLCKIVGIMEMDDSFLMRADDLLRQQHTAWISPC